MQVLRENQTTHCYVYDSPVGPLQLVSDGSSLIGLYFGNRTRAVASAGDPTVNPFPETIEQLGKYFGGSLEQFDLPILLHGTEHQLCAWNELRNIPYGETISYKAQAEKIGSVPRAVGLANGQNPVSIIVPCHRVIGANGSLVGYGGGLNRKRALLQFEANVRDFGPQPFDALSLTHGKPFDALSLTHGKPFDALSLTHGKPFDALSLTHGKPFDALSLTHGKPFDALSLTHGKPFEALTIARAKSLRHECLP
jgi:methylated-DNA-[protein]-cysteine S-methyltransferase